MASQDPSTAYTASPEKPKSWFPSFSLPKLPDFFGTGAPAPAASATAVAEQSSVQPGGRRRRGRKTSKKAGRRTRRGGLTPAEGVKFSDSDIREITRGTKADFPPVQVRKGKGGRRTRRVKKHSRC